MINISVATGLPARFKHGDIAYFQPNLKFVDTQAGTTDATIAAKCEIIGVGFGSYKVFYDIHIMHEEEIGGKTVVSFTTIFRVPSEMIAEAQV